MNEIGGEDMHRKDNLQILLDISNSMLAVAKKRDFEGLTLLEAKRNRILHEVIGDLDRKTSIAYAIQVLQAILCLDRKITAILEEERGHAASELMKLRKMKQAGSTYSSLFRSF